MYRKVSLWGKLSIGNKRNHKRTIPKCKYITDTVANIYIKPVKINLKLQFNGFVYILVRHVVIVKHQFSYDGKEMIKSSQ